MKTSTAEEFGNRAQSWLAENVPLLENSPAHANEADRIAYEKSVQTKLFDSGFGAITWPTEYGGQGLSDAEQTAWQKAASKYAIPRRAYAVSHGMCGPIINHLGTETQKRKYLPSLLRGDKIWCQLFSEPGAGSDIAGLQTRAERVDGGWVINGQKVWTSGAQWCDHGVLIARTDPAVPKHHGVTMFLINMRDPAVTVRPLRVANGDEPFNEVFFDDLRVEDADVLGHVNEGWAAAVAMLKFERISIGTGDAQAPSPYSYHSLLQQARESGYEQGPLVQAALVEAYVLEQGVKHLAARMRQEADSGIELGPRGSIAKLAGATWNRRMADLIDEIAGSSLIAWEGKSEAYPALTREFTSGPGTWIAGGTMEIQKNIIGERVLGLEKEPQVDKNLPFREIRRGS